MSRTVVTHIRSLALATLTLAAVTVTACQNDGPTDPARQPGSAALVKIKPTLYFNGILFAGTHDEPSGEIYSINPDGSSLFRLTTDTVTDGYPDVSPNGPAFIWARFSPNGKTSEIFSQNLDGSKRKQLTFLNTVAISPRYSPDGTKIAFTAVVPGAGAEIFTMNANGTAVVRLTFSAKSSGSPSWSPDGSKIVFESNDNNGNPSVWVMSANGNNQMMLKGCPSPGCTRPKWSPVANEIAVEYLNGTGIFVIDATSGAQTAFVPGSVNDMMPTWSKDGTRIIFSSMRAGGLTTYDLFATQPLRGGVTAPPPVDRLTALTGNEVSPAYSR
jgi:Tol biopolymer transport system component